MKGKALLKKTARFTNNARRLPLALAAAIAITAIPFLVQATQVENSAHVDPLLAGRLTILCRAGTFFISLLLIMNSASLSEFRHKRFSIWILYALFAGALLDLAGNFTTIVLSSSLWSTARAIEFAVPVMLATGGKIQQRGRRHAIRGIAVALAAVLAILLFLTHQAPLEITQRVFLLRPLEILPVILLMAAAIWAIPLLRRTEKSSILDAFWLSSILLFGAMIQTALIPLDVDSTLVCAVFVLLTRFLVAGGALREQYSAVKQRRQESSEFASMKLRALDHHRQTREKDLKIEELEELVAYQEIALSNFQGLFEGFQGLSLIISANGELSFATRQSRGLLGISQIEDLEGMDIGTYLQDPKAFDAILRHVQKHNHWEGELELIDAVDSTGFTMHAHVHRLPSSESGSPFQLGIIAQDTSRAKKMEVDLHRQRWLLNMTQVPIWEFSPAGKLLYCNEAAQGFLDTAPEFGTSMSQEICETLRNMNDMGQTELEQEIELNQGYYRQIVSMNTSEQRVILQIQDITSIRNTALWHEQLADRTTWLYEQKGRNAQPMEILLDVLRETAAWFELPAVVLSRQEPQGFTYVCAYPETYASPGKTDRLPPEFLAMLPEDQTHSFQISMGDVGELAPTLAVRITVAGSPWGVLYYCGESSTTANDIDFKTLDVVSRWAGSMIQELQFIRSSSSFFGYISSPLCICDLTGHLRLANPAFLEAFGLNDEEAQQVGLGELLVDGDTPFTDTWEEGVQSGSLTGKAFRQLSAPKEAWFAITATVNRESGAVYCVLLNITDVAKAGKVETEEAQYTILSRIESEIRTPLSGVLGMVDLLETTQLEDRQQQYLRQTRHFSEVILGLTTRIQEFARLEGEHLELNIAPFDLLETAENALAMLEGEAVRKEIGFFLRYPAESPRWFLGDAVRVEEIISNLISNAVKYTQIGHVYVDIHQTLLDEDLMQLDIHVKDTGIGVSLEDQERIFESFNQGSSAYQGTGLGLAIARKLAQMMDGDIKVESSPGRGSCFTTRLLLPLAPPAKRTQTTICELSIKKALLLIGDPLSMQVIRETLHDNALECQLFTSPLEALQAIESVNQTAAPYRLVIIDEQIPEPGFLPFAKMIRSNPVNRDLILVACSTHRRPTNTEHDASNLFDNTLCPPLTPLRIIHELEKVFSPELLNRGRKFVSDNTVQLAKPITALIAEGDAVSLDVLKELLTPLALNIDVATTAKEALDISEAQSHDIIFLDCEFPDGDGFSVARSIRRNQHGLRRTPIVAVTATGGSATRKRCKNAGMDGFLEKPIRRRRLNRVLREFLVDGKTFSDRLDRRTTETVNCPPIDLAIAAEDIGIEKQLLIRILQMFTGSLDEHLNVIDKAYSNGNGDRLASAARKLGGSAANLRILGLQEICLKVETLAENDDWRGLEPLLEQLERRAEVLKEFSRSLPVE